MHNLEGAVSAARDAALELAVWMTERNLSVKELAAKLGCTPDAVTRWRTRTSKPSRSMAVAIEHETEGRVPVAAWGA